MKEQAEKLWADVGPLDEFADSTQGIAICQSSLESAKEEGRREGHGKSGKWHHECVTTCPDCAKLKAEGAEELRAKVYNRAYGNYFRRGNEDLLRLSAIADLIQPPKPPTPTIPEWCYKAAEATCDGDPEEIAAAAQLIYEAHASHAPKPDAAKLAEAVVRELSPTYMTNLAEPIKRATAIIKQVLEGR